MTESSKTLFRVLMVLWLLAGSMVVAGCETSEGFGRDLEDLGGEIEEEAD